MAADYNVQLGALDGTAASWNSLLETGAGDVTVLPHAASLIKSHSAVGVMAEM